jgi:hypothetical protein
MSILVHSAIEMAAAKAAHHRLTRGVWTNVRFGDMRRALAGTVFAFCDSLNVSWPHGPFLCHYFTYRKEHILHCISLSTIPVSYLAFFLFQLVSD